jgi:hypothetical protein
MHRLSYCFFLLIIIFFYLFFSSCEIYNPKEAIPSYIKIESVSLTTTPEQGTNSHNISDVWIYIDDKMIGGFELPAKVPILNEGKHVLKVYPGIKINGIGSTRGIYPFYTYYSQTINLVKDSTIIIKPSFTYTSSVKFEWKENFEDGGVSLKTLEDSVMHKSNTENDKVFGGNYCGYINLINNSTTLTYDSYSSYALPKGIPIYMELNYKCNQAFTVGLHSYSSSGGTEYAVLTINNSNNIWKKIYVNLSNAVNLQPSVTNFYVYFQATKDTNIDNGKIFIDNIKLLHY